MRVFMAVNTRISDGFWYASDSNMCFLSRESAERHCLEVNNRHLDEWRDRVKEKSLRIQEKNAALNTIRAKLTDEENDFLMWAYDVAYETNYYDSPPEPTYKLTVIEFEVQS